MKIAIYGKQINPEFSDTIKEIFYTLNKKKVEISIFEPFFYDLTAQLQFRPKVNHLFNFVDDFDRQTNFVFSLGGDGTFLETLYFVRDSGIPVVGFNTGRLGFLADIPKQEVTLAINKILSDNYTLESRSLLELKKPTQLFNKFQFALNDFTIHKRDSSSMITVHAYLEGKFLNSYWADGLIISTPTGSTAYSMSAGGPIVMPDTNTFVITPIAPHNLTIRPLVISDKMTLTLNVESRDENFLISLDSRCEVVNNTIEMEICKANFCLNVLKLDNHEYFQVLRNKLMWGQDKRN